MDSLGVIAAAGRASRFNGIPKEMLPVGNMSLLERNIQVLLRAGCKPIVIVTSPEKIAMHAWVVRDYDRVILKPQLIGQDIYGAMYTGMMIPHSEIKFVMADTYLPIGGWKEAKHPFSIGTFITDEPSRFGVLRGNRFVNKPPFEDTNYRRAWGVLDWSVSVSRHWIEEYPRTYTDAINSAMDRFEYELWDLEYYYDVGDWEHYKELIDERTDFNR